MMKPCNKCLENQWAFELSDAVTVRATCKLCGHEVEFTTAKLQRKAKRVYPELPAYSFDTDLDYSSPPW